MRRNRELLVSLLLLVYLDFLEWLLLSSGWCCCCCRQEKTRSDSWGTSVGMEKLCLLSISTIKYAVITIWTAYKKCVVCHRLTVISKQDPRQQLKNGLQKDIRQSYNSNMRYVDYLSELNTLLIQSLSDDKLIQIGANQPIYAIGLRNLESQMQDWDFGLGEFDQRQIYDSQSDFLGTDHNYSLFGKEEDNLQVQNVQKDSSASVNGETGNVLDAGYIQAIDFICRDQCSLNEQPTEQEIAAVVANLQSRFAQPKMLKMAQMLYVWVVIQKKNAFERGISPDNLFKVKIEQTSQFKSTGGGFNWNDGESVRDGYPRTKRAYRKRQGKFQANPSQQILSKSALMSMKGKSPQRKTDGWRWDDLGNRIKTKSKLPATSAKRLTLNNSLTVNKLDVSSSFSPELAIKHHIFNRDGTVILTNRGMLPKKASVQERLSGFKDLKDYRFIEREVAARAFCDRGYGIPMLRAQIDECGIKISIDDKRYKAVSTAFVAESFRRMQKFLKDGCKQQIKIANSAELKVLFTILLNCRDNFLEDEARTFVKFVRLTYELAEVEVTQEQAVRLYRRFISSMQEKIKVQRYDSQKGTFDVMKQSKAVSISSGRPSPEELWTRQRELEFYDVYLSTRSLKEVRNYFRAQYAPERIKAGEVPGFEGQYSMAFYQAITDMKMLTSKYHKTIRSGLRRIQVFAQRNEKVPRLNRVNDDVVKRMFSFSQGNNLRRVIFEAQKMSRLQPKIVCEAVMIINDFIALCDTVKSQGDRSEVQSEYLVDF